jgi:WD40 repeat protein
MPKSAIRLAFSLVLVLVACQSQPVNLWDKVASGAPPVCFVTSGAPVAFLPDNLRLLLQSAAGTQIIHLETLQSDTFPASGPVIALAPDGNTLAWALPDNTIQEMRLADKTILRTLTGHTGPITKLKFSPDGTRLYSASLDTWVRIWNRTGSLLHAFQPTGADDFPSPVLGIGISPDGTQLAVIPADGPVKIWGLDAYNPLKELGGSGGYDTSDIVFSPDGKLLAADLATGLFLWRLADGAELLSPGLNSLAVAFSPDGRLLAYSEVTDTSTVNLTSPDGAQKIHTLPGHLGPVWELVFSPDSSILASTDGVETRLWRVSDGKLLYIGKSDCP